jgi:hypothetical protein
MRFLLPDPLGNDKNCRMFHSSLWAAGISTAVGVAGTIASSAMQADAANKAAGASSSSNKKLIKQQTANVGAYVQELEAAKSTYNANLTAISSAVSAIDPKIKIPNYSLLGTPDVYKTDKKGNIKYNKKTGLPIIKDPARASAVLEGIKAANEITTNSLYQLENVLPGAAAAREKAMKDIEVWEGRLEEQYNKVQQAYPMLEKAEAGYGEARQQYEQAGQILQEQLPQLREARAVAGEYLTGDLPDVTKRQITRAIAEAGGAAYNPEAAKRTSGFQVPQALLSQNLAEAAEERQRFGLNAVSNITGQTGAMSAGQANLAQGQESMAQGLQNIGMAYGQAGAASANMGEAARGMQATNMAWQNLSQSFLQNVPQMMQIGLAGRGQDIDMRKFEIQTKLGQQEMLANLAASQFNASTGVAGNIFDARSGVSQQQNAARQQNIQTNLAAQNAQAQMWADIGQGISSIGNSAMGAYNQYATAAANRPITGPGGNQYVPFQGSGGTAYRLQR